MRNAELEAMTDAEILAFREKSSKEYQRLTHEAVRVGKILKAIRQILRIRRLNRDGRPLVSDHALLRYLQRVQGLDTEAIRDDIQAKLPVVGKGKNWKDVDCIEMDGYHFYLSNDKRCITTVMEKISNEEDKKVDPSAREY